MMGKCSRLSELLKKMPIKFSMLSLPSSKKSINQSIQIVQKLKALKIIIFKVLCLQMSKASKMFKVFVVIVGIQSQVLLKLLRFLSNNLLLSLSKVVQDRNSK